MGPFQPGVQLSAEQKGKSRLQNYFTKPTQMAADGEQCRMGRWCFQFRYSELGLLKLAWLHLAANSSLVCLSRVVQRRMSTFIELARDLRSTGLIAQEPS